MSRIGQKIIEIPDNVEVILSQDEIKLTGPKGELSTPIFEGSNIEIAQKAWKELAAQNHPDRMIANGVPKELLGMANEKLAIINGAYDRILKAHKIKAGSEEI